MELTVAKRTTGKKSAAKVLRREGQIPAVVYSKGEKSIDISVNATDFRKILSQIEPGSLSTRIFTLNHIEGEALQVIVKDIQYNVVTYDVIHLDFQTLEKNNEIAVNIPIRLTGVVDCVGVKLGGMLQQIVKKVKVRCLPEHLPEAFEINVKDLGIGQSLSLRDMNIPQTVRPLMDLKDTVVVVTK